MFSSSRSASSLCTDVLRSSSSRDFTLFSMADTSVSCCFLRHKSTSYFARFQRVSSPYKPVSQPCVVAKREKFWCATADTIKLDVRTAGCNKSFQSFFFVPTQLHFRQRSSLLFCLPSLIVQWPTRIVHFSLLRMIVKLVYRRKNAELGSPRMSLF